MKKRWTHTGPHRPPEVPPGALPSHGLWRASAARALHKRGQSLAHSLTNRLHAALLFGSLTVLLPQMGRTTLASSKKSSVPGRSQDPLPHRPAPAYLGTSPAGFVPMGMNVRCSPRGTAGLLTPGDSRPRCGHTVVPLHGQHHSFPSNSCLRHRHPPKAPSQATEKVPSDVLATSSTFPSSQ